MKPLPLPSMPGNVATLHNKTPHLYRGLTTEQSKDWTSAAWSGNHKSVRFGLISEGCRRREAKGLSRTSWGSCGSLSCYCNPKCAVINPGDNVAQGTRSLPDSKGVGGPGWTAEGNADRRDTRLSHTHMDLGTVRQGIVSSYARGVWGKR